MEGKEEIITVQNKREILLNFVNACILGGAVFFGAFLDGGISRADLIASFGSAMILFLAKFGEYWAKEQTEYSSNKFGVFV